MLHAENGFQPLNSANVLRPLFPKHPEKLTIFLKIAF
jgi:hypothetical protein